MPQIDLATLKQRVDRLYLEFPELKDDEELALDVIEGQTDAMEILEYLTEKTIHAQALQEIIVQRKKDLDVRKARFEAHEAAYRKLALEIMDVCRLKKLPLPIATLSVRPGQPAVRIIDPSAIPEPFWRIKREPAVSQIKEALKAGQSVPGTSLNNPQPILAILTR